MRSFKILSGAAVLGLLVWACSDADSTSDLTGAEDAGKDSRTSSGDATVSGDDSTSDDDATTSTEDATTSTDSSMVSDSSTVTDGAIADAATDAKGDSGVVDSGVIDSGYDSGVYYAVGGNLSNLAIAVGSEVVLQNNLGSDLTLSMNGPFAFGTKVGQGATYSVTVKTQPTTPPQTCTVTNATGTIAGANVADVAVTCALNTYNVGGTITGLRGTIVLQNNAGDNKSISTGATYTFPTKVTTGLGYAATILTQPDGQWCTLSNKSGTIGSADVTNVNLTCVEATNCKAIRTADPSAPTGFYTLDTDSAGATPSMNAYCDMTTAGGGWTQVFDHDVSKGYRAYNTWASVNPTLPNTGLYSILDTLAALKSGANYEFYMNWPTGTAAVAGKSIQWTQVENPTSVTDPTAVTISSVTMTPATQTGCSPFAGLAKKASNTYLSGERGGCWWFSIGAAQAHNDGVAGIPAFDGSAAGHGGSATRAQLWVR